MRQNVRVYLLTEAPGGVFRHVVDLYWGLVESGWSVMLIVSIERLEPFHIEELSAVPAMDLMILPMKRSPHPSDIGVLSKLIGVLRKDKSRKILHTHSTKTGLLGALLQPWFDASLFTPHAYRSVDPELSSQSRKAIRFIERSFSLRYDRILAVAPAELDYALDLGIPADRVIYIANGIHIQRYELAPKPRPRSSDELVLGFVGRLVPQKSPKFFLQILAELLRRGQNIKGVVAGSGPLMDGLKEAAGELKLTERIEWLGTAPAKVVFARANALLHTSTYEAMPYTLIESAAASVPLIATRNHGSVAILEELAPESIVDDSTPQAFSDRIEHLFGDETVYREHIKNLQQVAKAFSVENMISAIADVYDSLLNKKSV